MPEITAKPKRVGKSSYMIIIPKALFDYKVLDASRDLKISISQEEKGGTGVIWPNFLDPRTPITI